MSITMKLHRNVVKDMLEIHVKYKFKNIVKFFKINLQKLLFLPTDCCCVCVCVCSWGRLCAQGV